MAMKHLVFAMDLDVAFGATLVQLGQILGQGRGRVQPAGYREKLNSHFILLSIKILYPKSLTIRVLTACTGGGMTLISHLMVTCKSEVKKKSVGLFIRLNMY